MRTILCRHCSEHWPVLQDGTLVEHPQADNPYFLCAGSRTKAHEGDVSRESSSRPLPKHEERRRPTYVTN